MSWLDVSLADCGGRWRTLGVGASLMFALLSGSGLSQQVLWTAPNLLSGEGDVSLASIGDLDGDGVPELVVGDPGFDPVQQDQGQVLLLSGRDGTLIYRRFGIGASDRFGASVSGGGDINGDGIPDFLVGAPGDDRFGLESGAVYAYSGLDGSVIHAVGELSLRRLGQVFDLGDVNADGQSDFGAIANDGWAPLRVYSGHDASLLWVLEAPLTGIFNSAARMGDVDGDGHADIAAASFGEPVIFIQEGFVGVYSGRTGEQMYVVGGTLAFDTLGHSIAAVQDVSGDGVRELLIGAPQTSPLVPGTGYALLVDGRIGTIRRRLEGEAAFDVFGWFVADAGDINGDGAREFLITSPGWSRPSKNMAGRTFLHSGASTNPLQRFDRPLVHASRLGDVNGDGLADWAVFGAGFLPTGQVSVIAGEPLHTITSPESVQGPTPVSIVTSHGAPGQVVLLYLTAIDGAPVSQLLDYGAFGPTGVHSISGVSPAISGLSLAVRSITRAASGTLHVSTASTVYLD